MDTLHERRQERSRSLPDGLESPFLSGELFVERFEGETTGRTFGLVSPFLQVFDPRAADRSPLGVLESAEASDGPLSALRLDALAQHVQGWIREGVFDISLLSRFISGEIWNEDHLALELFFYGHPELRPAEFNSGSHSTRLRLVERLAAKYQRSLTLIRERIVRPLFGNPSNFRVADSTHCEISDLRAAVRQLGPLPGGTNSEGRTWYKRDAQSSPRRLAAIDSVVLHQMALSRGNDLNSYKTVGAHYAVMADGQIAQLYDNLDYLNASNGFNPRSVAIEFAGNFPSESFVWWTPDKGQIPNRCYLTPAQIRAGRCLLTRLKDNLPSFKHLYAHRQSFKDRANDPGPDVWFNIGEWALKSLDLSRESPRTHIGTGKSITDSWRKPRSPMFQRQLSDADPSQEFRETGREREEQTDLIGETDVGLEERDFHEPATARESGPNELNVPQNMAPPSVNRAEGDEEVAGLDDLQETPSREDDFEQPAAPVSPLPDGASLISSYENSEAALRSAQLNIAEAVRLNSQYGTTLGWQGRVDDIVRLLGYSDYSPGPEEFANAVARWQHAQALSADGIIGPRTWERMITLLPPATPTEPIVPSSPHPGARDLTTAWTDAFEKQLVRLYPGHSARNLRRQNAFNEALQHAESEWDRLDPLILKSLLAQESSFDPTLGNKRGFAGIAQLGMEEARSVDLSTGASPIQTSEHRHGLSNYPKERFDLANDQRFHPDRAIPAAARLLKRKADSLAKHLFARYGTPEGDDFHRLILGAYNAGEGNVIARVRRVFGSTGPGGIQFAELGMAGWIRYADVIVARARQT